MPILLSLIAQCSFYASVSSLNILLGYIENLTVLKLDLKTLTIPTRNLCEGFLIFTINLPLTIAFDVTHLGKIMTSKLDRKPERKQHNNYLNFLYSFENIPIMFEIG